MELNFKKGGYSDTFTLHMVMYSSVLFDEMTFFSSLNIILCVNWPHGHAVLPKQCSLFKSFYLCTLGSSLKHNIVLIIVLIPYRSYILMHGTPYVKSTGLQCVAFYWAKKTHVILSPSLKVKSKCDRYTWSIQVIYRNKGRKGAGI